MPLTRVRSLIRVSFSTSIERFLTRSRRGMLRVQQKLIKHAQQHRAAGCIDITGPKIAGVESGAGEVSHEREACQVG